MSTGLAEMETAFLGDLPPLSQSMRRQPDKRRVSLRWLSGAVLTGVVSVVLMGGALFAAIDDRAIVTATFMQEPQQDVAGAVQAQKGSRPGAAIISQESTSSVMMVSTVSREGDRDIVKVKPFLRVSTPLAIPVKRQVSYPSFNALTVFADSSEPEAAPVAGSQIYGAAVESEVSIKIEEFDPGAASVSPHIVLSETDIEELVRNAAPGLAAGTTTVASLSYFDPTRFSLQQENGLVDAAGVTITEENVQLVAKKLPQDRDAVRYDERIIRVRSPAPIAVILEAEGFLENDAKTFEKVLSSDLGSGSLQPEDQIRVAYEISGESRNGMIEKPMRVSAYRQSQHVVSIARNDAGQLVYAREPELAPQATNASGPELLSASARLPSIYDAIYRAVLSEGLDVEIANRLVRVFAFDLDYNSVISANDELSFFVSLDEATSAPTKNSDIIYASIRNGTQERRYYRFRDPETGQADYFDETGKSAKKFLLRQTVPNGKFRSAFGMRTHPILRYRKMHWGVDWSAPRGTPIIAAGNGTVETAGWESGYGKQTTIRHANGYVTSYSHQSKIASNVTPGAKVRQGQVIGYVGSTGLSTGPHLHYEVVVNGTKVDPMRIRLPKGLELKGKQLAAFLAERERLDELLKEEREDESPQLAASGT
jgi:murein DD-endopeptidase MepM/ murein hydrolase activator NlpD